MTEITPEIRRIGYARVSTYGQTLGAQLEQLAADGCGKVYREKASGAQADRRELQRMLKHRAQQILIFEPQSIRENRLLP